MNAGRCNGCGLGFCSGRRRQVWLPGGWLAPVSIARNLGRDGQGFEREIWMVARHEASAIFQSESGASAPLACSAAFMIKNVLVGNLPRCFHIGTAEVLSRLVMSLTALKPPSSEMTSSTVLSCLTIALFITVCDYVKPHGWELGGPHFVYKNDCVGLEPKKRFWEQGRRLRWLRQAERITTGSAFAAYIGWAQSGYSQFETGERRVPMDKALQLRAKIPGFDPIWLWEGEKRGLSFDLRQRIDAEEERESAPQSASGERQDV